MKRIVLILLMLAVAAPAFAAAKKCPPKCTHRKAATCAKPAASVATPLWSALVEGFEVSAGFRWAPEHDCPTPEVPDPPTETRDPFYVGVGLRVPLAPRAALFGAFDRDFTDAPHWQVRTGLAFTPFAR